MTTYTLIVRNGETVANCARLSEAALYAVREIHGVEHVISIKIVDVDHIAAPVGSDVFDVYHVTCIYDDASTFVQGAAWAMGLKPTLEEGVE